MHVSTTDYARVVHKLALKFIHQWSFTCWVNVPILVFMPISCYQNQPMSGSTPCISKPQ